MALSTKCSTPDTNFNIQIQPDRIRVVVYFPQEIPLNEEEAIHLERTIHNAMELALAPLFVPRLELKCTHPEIH